MLNIPDAEQAKAFFEAKMAFTTGPVELNSILQSAQLNIVDVRMADDYQKDHIPGSINLPINQWENLDALKKDGVNVLYCYSHVCHLAAKAAAKFSAQGFPVMELDGGFNAWKEHGFPTES